MKSTDKKEKDMQKYKLSNAQIQTQSFPNISQISINSPTNYSTIEKQNREAKKLLEQRREKYKGLSKENNNLQQSGLSLPTTSFSVLCLFQS